MRSIAATGRISEGRGLFAALCLLLLASLVLGGCSQGKGASAGKSEYLSVLDRWSGGVKVYEGLEARLYLSATYKSEEFRRAYIERYSESYGLGQERSQALLERELEQGQEYNELFFTAYTPDERLNDFDRKDTVWQLYLEDDSGARVRPITVARMEVSEAVTREFFPYFDLWSRAYVAKFPKYAETGLPMPGQGQAMRLVVTGIFGKGAIEWRPVE